MFHRPKTETPPGTTAGNPAPAQPQQAQAPQQAQPQPQQQNATSQHAPRPSATSAWAEDTPFSAAVRQSAAPAPTAEPVQEKEPARSSPFPKDNTETKPLTHKPEEKKMNIKEDQQDRPSSIPGQSAYQPTPASPQPPRVPGASYAYPGAAAPTSPYSSAVADKKTIPSGRRLVIGEGITMSGEIEACDYLVVEGTVEAALKGASVLEIAENGVFYGTVEIDEATIAGRFEGDIVVGGRLTVTSTGSITGSIAYKELAVEAGATLDGKINPLGGSKAANVKKNDKPPMKAKYVRNDNADEANQLPFAGSAAAE